MVRNTDPITSRLADLQLDTRAIQARVIFHLTQYGPKTSRELSEELGIEYVTVSPQLRPLCRDGVVHEEGLKRNTTGRFAVAWAIGGTPGGMPALATGPQDHLHFQRFNTWDELHSLFQRSGQAGFVDALNEEIVRRLG